MLVAKARTIEYKNAEIDVAECKTYGHFDARLTIQEKYLHVFVSYKARPFLRPADISLFCGILEINVEDFRKQKAIGIDSCKEQLKNVLLNESPFKRWRYHGREQRLEQEFERLKPVIKQSSSTAKNLQKINLNLQKKVRRDTTIIVTPQENSAPAKWRCVLCKIEYSGHSIGVNPCPQCGSHLYRVQLDNDTRHP